MPNNHHQAWNLILIYYKLYDVIHAFTRHYDGANLPFWGNFGWLFFYPDLIFILRHLKKYPPHIVVGTCCHV